MLSYTLGNYDDTERDIRWIQRLLQELKAGSERDQRYGMLTSHLEVYAPYMLAVTAAARSDWDGAIAITDGLAAAADSIQHPALSNSVRLSAIDALLGRNAAGDLDRARALLRKLIPLNLLPSTDGWSDSPELAIARIAARALEPEARTHLERALQSVEAHADRTPLLADWAFDRIAAAADECGATDIAHTASARCMHYRRRRADAVKLARVP
jgi:hypothetical protein